MWSTWLSLPFSNTLVQVMRGTGLPDAPQYRFRSDLSLTEWSPLTLLKSVGETKSKKRKNHVKEWDVCTLRICHPKDMTLIQFSSPELYEAILKCNKYTNSVLHKLKWRFKESILLIFFIHYILGNLQNYAVHTIALCIIDPSCMNMYPAHFFFSYRLYYSFCRNWLEIILRMVWLSN